MLDIVEVEGAYIVMRGDRRIAVYFQRADAEAFICEMVEAIAAELRRCRSLRQRHAWAARMARQQNGHFTN